jgi:hypothetical protein
MHKTGTPFLWPGLRLAAFLSATVAEIGKLTGSGNNGKWLVRAGPGGCFARAEHLEC